MRKFSIPYNNRDAELYLQSIEKYSDSIDSIYFGIPGIIDSHVDVVTSSIDQQLQRQQNTINFLQQSQNKYKRVLTVNPAFCAKSDFDKALYVYNTIIPFVSEFKIEGIIVSDFTLAKLIHQIIPDVELQTSCNTYQFLIPTMRYWEKHCGIKMFNPPRETLRIPSLLKQIHKAGFKTKYIVNEPCMFGCPQQINHACYIAARADDCEFFCDRKDKDLADILKSNVILPRWLPILDQYVDVYKLSGRARSTKSIVYMLDAYVNLRNDVLLNDIIVHRSSDFYKDIKIPVNIIPDKLLTCQCLDCDNCKLCDDIIADCAAQ